MISLWVGLIAIPCFFSHPMPEIDHKQYLGRYLGIHVQFSTFAPSMLTIPLAIKVQVLTNVMMPKSRSSGSAYNQRCQIPAIR